jgi:hypothetical protein
MAGKYPPDYMAPHARRQYLLEFICMMGASTGQDFHFARR